MLIKVTLQVVYKHSDAHIHKTIRWIHLFHSSRNVSISFLTSVCLSCVKHCSSGGQRHRGSCYLNASSDHRQAVSGSPEGYTCLTRLKQHHASFLFVCFVRFFFCFFFYLKLTASNGVDGTVSCNRVNGVSVSGPIAQGTVMQIRNKEMIM